MLVVLLCTRIQRDHFVPARIFAPAQNTVTAHISAEAVVEFVHQNTKAVGYTVLLAAGAYYVLAFLSWGYRNQINALGEEEAPVADQQELASEFTAAASRYAIPKHFHPSRFAAPTIAFVI